MSMHEHFPDPARNGLKYMNTPTLCSRRLTWVGLLPSRLVMELFLQYQ